MKRNAILSAVISIILIIGLGCSTVRDSVMKGATSGIGRAVSERAEQAVYKRVAPKASLPAAGTPGWNQFMTLQAQVIFSYSFSAGGLWIGPVDYKPGEWTKFEFKVQDEPSVVLEKAFLKRTDDGKEWWRVSWTTAEEGTWVYEALIATEESQLLRLRARDVDGNEGEIPVTGGEVIYMAPTEVTQESIQGATVGKENITTPAGTFSADHVVYMAVTGEGEIEWWVTDKVPGGVVKYQLKTKEEGVIWSSTLKEKGTNATTILKSF